MYPINDHEYLKTCAEIARIMSISLSSAKRKVEIQISKMDSKTIEDKRKVANKVLKICLKENESGLSSVKLFDDLMESLEENDNFLVED